MRFKFFCLLFILTLKSFAQSTASQNVRHFEIEAPELDTIRQVWIYLPENYETTEKRFPVIYMHDGQNLFDRETSYVGEWKVDESLDSIKNPEAIIVGINHSGDKRISELTPFPHEKYGGGKADLYLDFIVNRLKPYIDANYRTLTSYENTGIFGSSLGGLVSFYAALKYPDTFSKIGVFSPSFWFSKKIYEYAENADLNAETKFYFLAGTAESEETIPDMNRMITLLEKKNLKSENFKVKYVEGGEHNETLWSESLPEAFLWLMN